MVKSPKIKILNIISGSKYGGAELFFERLALSFERCDKIEQKIIILNNRNRSKKFIDGINEIEKINFFHKLNPFCTFKIEKIIREYKPPRNRLPESPIKTLYLDKLKIKNGIKLEIIIISK